MNKTTQFCLLTLPLPAINLLTRTARVGMCQECSITQKSMDWLTQLANPITKHLNLLRIAKSPSTSAQNTKSATSALHLMLRASANKYSITAPWSQLSQSTETSSSIKMESTESTPKIRSFLQAMQSKLSAGGKLKDKIAGWLRIHGEPTGDRTALGTIFFNLDAFWQMSTKFNWRSSQLQSHWSQMSQPQRRKQRRLRF